MANRSIPSSSTPSPIAAPSAGSTAAPLIKITAAWNLDLAGRRLVAPAGEVLLPALEFRLLLTFLRHPDRVLTRTELLDVVWGRDFAGMDRVVDQAVYWLRQAIEPDPARPCYLRTRRGLGYTYRPPPSNSLRPDNALMGEEGIGPE